MTAVTLETVAAAEARAAATLQDAQDYADSVLTGGSGGNDHYNIQILPWLNWKASSVTPTRNVSSSRLGCGFVSTSNVSGNWIEFNVALDAGTWTATIIHDKATNYGEAAVKLDGTTVGTLNQYNGSSLTNQVAEITGIVVASSGDHVLRFENTGTGGGSSYGQMLIALGFQRTA